MEKSISVKAKGYGFSLRRIRGSHETLISFSSRLCYGGDKVTHVKEWTTRSAETAKEWGAGPWENEPDKIQWVDDETGLDCLMHRHPSSGHWCGYVGVAEGHPYFGVEYSGCTLKPPCGETFCDHTPEVEVHGGLTYSNFCQDVEDESKGICHVPLEGRPHKVWWLGFDCAHLGDLSGLGYPRGVYRDRAFVEKEIRSLAAQLATR